MKNGKQQKGYKNKKQLINDALEFYSDYEYDKKSNESDDRQKSFSCYTMDEIDAKITKPLNKSQELYYNLLRNVNKKVIIATGPAGTGKTLLSTEFGIRNFACGNCEKLVFTRPSDSVDEDLGYLPGSYEDKMSPWVRPIYDILYNFISPKEVSKLIEDKFIEISPLGYMRGRTFKNCWIIADEMQNSTVSQMKMLLTRMGENSRIVITGDLEQCDNTDEMNGLDDFLNKFKGRRSSSISSIEFQCDDIQREEVVKEVLEIYDSDCIPTSYTLDKNNMFDSTTDT